MARPRPSRVSIVALITRFIAANGFAVAHQDKAGRPGSSRPRGRQLARYLEAQRQRWHRLENMDPAQMSMRAVTACLSLQTQVGRTCGEAIKEKTRHPSDIIMPDDESDILDGEENVQARSLHTCASSVTSAMGPYSRPRSRLFITGRSHGAPGEGRPH